MLGRRLEGASEWLTAIGIVFVLLPVFLPVELSDTRIHIGHFSFIGSVCLRQLGLATFLAGVLTSIKDIRQRATATEKTMLIIQNALESAQKFGPAVNRLAGVISQSVNQAPCDPGTVHIRASGKILSYHVTEELPAIAEHLLTLQSGHGKMELAEPFFVSQLLKNIEEILPDGSVWCGITCMTRGWIENKGEPGFYEFSENLRRRAAQGRLSIFRVYAVGAEPSVQGFRQHIDKEVASGIHVKILSGRDAVRDISLLWQPMNETQRVLLEGAGNPIMELSSAKAIPVCGLQFETRLASMFQSVSIVSCETPEFGRLTTSFADAWDRARTARPPQTDSGASVPPNGIDRRYVGLEAA
jgi:hypothetical protein